MRPGKTGTILRNSSYTLVNLSRYEEGMSTVLDSVRLCTVTTNHSRQANMFVHLGAPKTQLRAGERAIWQRMFACAVPRFSNAIPIRLSGMMPNAI